jgi:rfaE bifunctional protein kinase chain/domain
MQNEPVPVLVVGDSMLDRYGDGAVERISPEAPVPVLRMGREWERPGGAANVAVNLAALRGRPVLATLLGDDAAGTRLAELVEEGGAALHAVRRADVVTTQKIRAVCRRQQLLRVDIEQPASADAARVLADRVAELLPAHRWLVLSDYDKGALRHCDAMIRRAAANGVPALVDPKGDDFRRYAGAWLLKPNEAEAARAVGAWSDEDDFDARMLALRRSLGVEHLLVTRGEHGMALFGAARPALHIAAMPREVYDVSGAGDTVLAALVSALAAGETLEDAVRFANRAAGVAVGKFGTATVSRAELRPELVAVAPAEAPAAPVVPRAAGGTPPAGRERRA